MLISLSAYLWRREEISCHRLAAVAISQPVSARDLSFASRWTGGYNPVC